MSSINSVQNYSFQYTPGSSGASRAARTSTPPTSFADSVIPARSELKSEETATGLEKQVLTLVNKLSRELKGKVDDDTINKIIRTIQDAFHDDFHAGNKPLKQLDINIQDIIDNPDKMITIPININGAILDKLNTFSKESELAGLDIRFEYIDGILDENHKSIDTLA